MATWAEILGTALVTLIASSGFWAWLAKRSEKYSKKSQLLIGLAHDRICYLGMQYINRGSITQDEYENLHDYLFKPYEALGGNGSAARIMREVDKLEIKPYKEEKK